MNNRGLKQTVDNSVEAVSIGISYVSVLKKALKMLGVFEIFMKDEMEKDHQDNRKASGLEIGNATETSFRTGLSIFHGASGIDDGRPNSSRSLDVTPLLMMSLRTLTGLSNRSFAVLMIVMSVQTFFCPCFVIFPKVIFLKRTAFRIPCSARLFVGSMAGFFRKTKSSFLWVISRLRMLLVSWCDMGSCRYKPLNLLRISFLAERYISGVKTWC